MTNQRRECSVIPILSRRWFATAIVLAFTAGCVRQVEPVFTVRKELTALPIKHQQQITEVIRRLFGTPVNPRLMAPDPTAEESDAGPAPLIDIAGSDQLKRGAAVYSARCSGCHGVTGDGAGPAADLLRPRPRDYRKGIFKFTSTPYGHMPARHDLVRTIRRGAKGTSMPAFPWMSDEDLNAVIDYVVYLSLRGKTEEDSVTIAQTYAEDEDFDVAEIYDALQLARDRWREAESEVVLPQSAEPLADEESARKGRVLFLTQGCSKCHGENAKGQTEWLSPEFLAKQQAAPAGEREQINYDAWGQPAPAADITARFLHGGRRPLDVYRRIYTGINGTPMPAFGEQFASEPDKIWQMVHYVLHVIEGGDPSMQISAADVVVAPTSEAK